MKIKSPKNRTFIGMWALLLITLLLPSCTTAKSYYEYTQTAFSARVEGTLNGVEIQAKIAAVPCDGGFFMEVEYLAPDTLAGLSLTGSCTQQGKAVGEITYRFFGKSGTSDAAVCKDLLLPVTALLNVQDPARVERNEEGYLLSFSENSLLQLNEDSIPTRIHSNNVDFWVVWWDFQSNSD